MKQLSPIFTALCIVLLATIVLPLSQATAANGTVHPPAGQPNATFTFAVSGFGDGEQLGIWATDPRGNRYDNDQRAFADGQGNYTWTWTAPADAAGGAWEMTIEGYWLHSATITIPFTIDAPAVPYADQTSSMVLPANHGPPGTTFTFVSRGGFEPNEQVGTWFVQPDGSELRISIDISSDSQRQIYRVWTSPPDAKGGDWFFMAKGRDSSHTIRIPFYIDNPSDKVINPSNEVANPTIAAPVVPPPTHKVTPEHGQRGTTFTFVADGFTPGERVATWVIMPDGTVPDQFPEEYTYASTNPTGDVTWTWTAPNDVPPGNWQMVARGIFSRVEWVIPFTIDDTPVTPTPEAMPTLNVSPNHAPVGSTFRFTVSGYLPEEHVYFWAIDPTNTPDPNERELVCDNQGTVTWEWEVKADRMPGEWTMYTRGSAGWKTASVIFYVEGEPPQGIRMQPESGGPGTTFAFVATGFHADEEMNFWLTGAKTDQRRFDQEYDLVDKKLHADEQGSVQWEWTAPANIVEGTWHMTARGEESRIERIISFPIIRDDPLPLPYSVSPTSGAPGTTFTFTINDMPTSRAAYWVTAPDGTIYPLDRSEYLDWRIHVDDNGYASWTWTVPADAQRGTWTMIVRNLSDNLLLRPPKDREDIPRYEEDRKEHQEDTRDQAIEYREYVIPFRVE